MSYWLYDFLTDGKITTTGRAWLSFRGEGLLVALLIRGQQAQLDNEHLLRENLNVQFDLLKQQVAPHFLFNSLNTLKSLIRRGQPLDDIERELGLTLFYRCNRQWIVARQSVLEVEPYFNRKLLVRLRVTTAHSILVSKEKAPEFLRWLEGGR